MIEIISRNNGPRKEDAAAKAFLRQNAPTINKIVDQLSGGRARAAPPLAAPARAEARRGGRPAANQPATASPYTHVSLNGRVVAIDFNTGRQLHHIGAIRGRGPWRRFVVASEANGFFSPLQADLAERLQDLDGAPAPDEAAEEALVQKIDARLGFSAPGAAPPADD